MKVYGDLERKTCPICASPEVRPLWRIPYTTIDPAVLINGAYTRTAPILNPASTIYSYALCDDCGSIFLSPYRSEVDIYERDTSHVEAIKTQSWAGYENQHKNWIAPYVLPRHRTLLDAGCGAGHYLFLAQRSGHPWKSLTGIEIKEPSIAYINETSKGAIVAYKRNIAVKGSLTALRLQADFIVFSEVFEHVDEPRTAIGNLWGVLRPGGRMFMTAQSPEGNLPVRPDEPIYTTHKGLELLLGDMAPGAEVIEWKEEAGRWKLVLQKP